MTNDLTSADFDNAPEWARECILKTHDDGVSTDGEYGYECHAVMAGGGDVIGWMYDTGAGSTWLEGCWGPEPLAGDQRPGW